MIAKSKPAILALSIVCTASMANAQNLGGFLKAVDKLSKAASKSAATPAAPAGAPKPAAPVQVQSGERALNAQERADLEKGYLRDSNYPKRYSGRYFEMVAVVEKTDAGSGYVLKGWENGKFEASIWCKSAEGQIPLGKATRIGGNLDADYPYEDDGTGKYYYVSRCRIPAAVQPASVPAKPQVVALNVALPNLCKDWDQVGDAKRIFNDMALTKPSDELDSSGTVIVPTKAFSVNGRKVYQGTAANFANGREIPGVYFIDAKEWGATCS